MRLVNKNILALLLMSASIAKGELFNLTDQSVRGVGSEDLDSVLYDDEYHLFFVNGLEVPRYNLDSELRKLSRFQMKTFLNADSYFVVSTDSSMEHHISGYLRLRGGVYGEDMDDDDYKVTVDQHGKAGTRYALPAVGGCVTSVTNSTVQGNIKSFPDGAAKCAGGAAAAVVGKAFWDAFGQNK